MKPRIESVNEIGVGIEERNILHVIQPDPM